jgi:hypothetical protein
MIPYIVKINSKAAEELTILYRSPNPDLPVTEILALAQVTPDQVQSYETEVQYDIEAIKENQLIVLKKIIHIELKPEVIMARSEVPAQGIAKLSLIELSGRHGIYNVNPFARSQSAA